MNKYNSMGQQYVQQSNAWSANKFMDEYALVNNELYPFVYGNPNGYGTNTNPDPFFWGQPQAPRYCACGQSLKISQAEGFCDSCAGQSGAQTEQSVSAPGGQYKEQAFEKPDDMFVQQGPSTIINSIKTLKKSNSLRVPATLGGVSDTQRNQLRRFAVDSLADTDSTTERMENFDSGRPYGTSRQYGTGSVGNGTIPGAPVVPLSYYEGFERGPKQPTCNSSTMIGQHPPLNITAAGGIEYMYDSPAIEAAGWNARKRQSFCESGGGKKLSF